MHGYGPKALSTGTVIFQYHLKQPNVPRITIIWTVSIASVSETILDCRNADFAVCHHKTKQMYLFSCTHKQDKQRLCHFVDDT